MIHYVADYLDNIRRRPVLPQVSPGYLAKLVPTTAPEKGEDWRDVMKDLETVIMPGVTHWHHPQFHAYFPTANSYPAIVADILSGAIACIGFSWIASPACTELEMVTLDWLGNMLKLPREFLFQSGGNGGGVIQGTASEATLVAVLSARARAVKEQKDPTTISRLVCYGSKQAHSSVERAGMLAGVRMRLLQPDHDLSLTGDILAAAVSEDRAAGLIPFCCVATLGTTNTCAFDNIISLGEVCRDQVRGQNTLTTFPLYMFRVSGSMWTLPTPVAPSYVPSSGLSWTGWSSRTASTSTLTSGCWSTSTALPCGSKTRGTSLSAPGMTNL